MLCRRPDLVITMTDPPMAGVLGAMVATRYRRPLVQVSHDVYPEIAEILGAVTNRYIISAWRRVNAMVRRRTAGIVVGGRAMRDLLAEQGVPYDRLHLIPMWAEDQTLSKEGRERTRETMLWGDKCVVMHAGNLGPAQNLDTLLDAAGVLTEDSSFLFVLMGDGAARAHLEKRIEEERLSNVHVLDYLPQEAAQQVMAAADMHVISLAPGLGPLAAPSKTYGILAAGRPYVAATDSDAEPALIAKEEDCGASCPPGDGAALAETIRRLREGPLDDLGRKAHDAFKRRFRREDVVAQMIRMLEGVEQGARSH
jgi:glycosyltransferase involved in cell wall biosynthesis